MADSPDSSDLSDIPSIDDSETEDHLSTVVPSSRPSVDIPQPEAEHLAPPPKRRKTVGPSSLSHHDRAPSSQPPEQEDDNISISTDGWSDAPDEPNAHSEWELREEAQTDCLWRDCPFGKAQNNDELVKHVQSTHCATGGPKRTKYVCEWGECQKKTSNHPSGYALKAHMRSHTKEKPYLCALPECDKAFTRSDALAKHMRTVHEPEQPRGATSIANDPTPPGRKSIKLKLTNGSAGASARPPPTSTDATTQGPTEDEDGNPVTPSPANDNITYIPAHHPLTGQAGFMIHYPPDVQFTAWESSINADILMKILRRQEHQAKKEKEALKREIELLEQERKQEWRLKELLLEGVLEAELAFAGRDGMLHNIDEHVREAMETDIQPSKQIQWAPSTPKWRHSQFTRSKLPSGQPSFDSAMPDAEMDTPTESHSRSPSPPPTGKSGGFDGDQDPYDNYVGDRMAEFERLRAERERLKNRQEESEAEKEADAVGALVGLSGGKA